jgi:hypothetical protein
MNNKVKEFADKPVRTNWDVLREDRRRVAGLAIECYWEHAEARSRYIAVLDDCTNHKTREAAIAANLAWLDAEVTQNVG